MNEHAMPMALVVDPGVFITSAIDPNHRTFAIALAVLKLAFVAVAVSFDHDTPTMIQIVDEVAVVANDFIIDDVNLNRLDSWSGVVP